LPVSLVAGSRGTFSVASLAVALDGEIAGAVLTSSLFYGAPRTKPRPVLAGFGWSAIQMPVLVVAHAGDGCPPGLSCGDGSRRKSRPKGARASRSRRTASSARKPRRSTPWPRGCWEGLFPKKSSNALRGNDLPVVVPALPGAAADRAADPAVVRRQRRGVDDLPAVLPGAAARGRRLREPAD